MPQPQNRPQIHRILDANFNRAREALRTMEEAARFLLNDAAVSGALKTLRHDLTAALAAVPDLARARDTPGDVGTTVTTDHEGTRTSTHHVVQAAASRLTESLRVIEEYGKLLPTPPPVEPLRYRAYALERRLLAQLRPGARQPWHLCLLLTRSLCKQPWEAVLDAAVAHGVDCVQVREKELDASPLFAHARAVVARVGDRATVIVNDRPDVALAAGAHGVHLGQDDLPCRAARRLFGHQLIIGVSTSNLAQARQAQADGADYCGVGPMFPTTTKHKPVLAGPPYLADYTAAGGLPHPLAIGGINETNAPTLVAAAQGPVGLAVSSAICTADDPAAATAALRSAAAASSQAD